MFFTYYFVNSDSAVLALKRYSSFSRSLVSLPLLCLFCLYFLSHVSLYNCIVGVSSFAMDENLESLVKTSEMADVKDLLRTSPASGSVLPE